MASSATDAVRIVSPVDGSVIAERALADDDDINGALTAARAAQRDWKRRPLAERAESCSAAVDAMLAMRADIVPELA